MVMFEDGFGAGAAALAPEPAAEPLGTACPEEFDEPLVVPGAVDPVLDEVEPAGPIALPGIAGPGSPGYITVPPMPVMISGRCS